MCLLRTDLLAGIALPRRETRSRSRGSGPPYPAICLANITCNRDRDPAWSRRGAVVCNLFVCNRLIEKLPPTTSNCPFSDLHLSVRVRSGGTPAWCCSPRPLPTYCLAREFVLRCVACVHVVPPSASHTHQYGHRTV